MPNVISISPSVFGQVFQRFQIQVSAAKDSPGPFEDFQSGLIHSMESYKEWLYFEARDRLNLESWSEDWIGTGRILQFVLNAIEINEGKGRRNNIVQWEGRYGPNRTSHHKMYEAKENGREAAKAEKALWDMYVLKASPERCFGRLVDLFGGRYDLISYLFFIRDWNQFMPVKSSFFPKVFQLLQVPHPMMKQCHWQNYAGVLARLREVQRHLSGYNIPNGVRLVDAHSFCWLLNSLPAPIEDAVSQLTILPLIPEAGAAPNRAQAGRDTTEDELDDIHRNRKRIGDLAQYIVLKAERHRLKEQRRPDLAQQVRDVSDDVSLGYDISSFTSDGEPKPIEVKASAKRGDDLRFFVSQNELFKARNLSNYHFILVLNVESDSPILREFGGTTLPDDALYPVQYEVRLKNH